MALVSQLFVDVASYTGCLRNRGVATTNSATVVTDNVRELTPDSNANAVIGNWIVILDGARAGDYREITAYASNAMTFPTLTGAPGSASW